MPNFLKKLFCLVPLVAWFCLPAAIAQTTDNVVRGKITDKRTKVPLSGVSVSEVDADGRIIKGAATDIEGNFVLRLSNPKNKLSVSFIGYRTVLQPINGRTSVNFQLEDANSEIEGVAVVATRKTGNGITNISDRENTTAVARINAKDMEEMAATSIDQQLQGRLAGVDITATSGDPGAAMNIRIRGTSSINSSGNPLIVLDGLPYETSIPSDFNFGTADEQGYAQLLNISPGDIQDITVLKDAAATAVWGSRAASGVLVITTKRGRIGKPTINYTFKGSYLTKPSALPMLNGDQYSTLIPEAFINRIGTTLNSQTAREFNYDPNDPYWYYNYSNNTNWVDAISKSGYLTDHQISMNGGGEKAKYNASIGYTNNTGTTLGTGLTRINSRINLDYNISDKIKIFTSIAYTHSDQKRNYLSGTNDNQIRGAAYIKMPNMSIFEYDELGNLSPNYFSPAANIQGQYSRIYNPIAMADKAQYTVLSERIIPRFQINYGIIKGLLNATFDIQFDINNTKNSSFLPQIATGRPSTEAVVNRAYNGDIDVFGVTTKTNISFTPTLKNRKHDIQGYLTIFTNDFKSVNQEIETSNTASSLLVDPSTPSRSQFGTRIASGIGQSRNASASLIGQYKFLDRYIVNLTLRGDGDSKFGPEYRYGLFPSISGKWIISDEPFFKKAKQLDNLAFRVSYGQVGNAPGGNYIFYNTYNTFAYSYLGQSGVFPSSMELKNLKWETVVGTNVGANVSLFKGRIRSDIDIYRNRTKDLYFPGLQIAGYTGYSSVNLNVGTMDNQGWELAIWTQPYKTKDLTIGFDFNVSKNENVIRSISEYYPASKGNVTANVGFGGDYLRLLQVDNPFGSFYGYRYKGVYADKAATQATGANGKPITGPNGQQIYMRFNYPSIDYTFQPGDAKYEDINNDGNIDYKDVVYLGNSNPKLSGGFGPSLNWKNRWRVTTFFSFRYGYDIINGTKISTTNMYTYDNQSTAVLRRWRKEGDITDMPRAIINGGYNSLGSDRYVEDASYLRFRTATIRYTFDPKNLAKIKMKNLSAYVTVDNIATFTRYTGQDPEQSSRGADPFRIAKDESMTPPSRTFTLGVVTGF